MGGRRRVRTASAPSRCSGTRTGEEYKAVVSFGPRRQDAKRGHFYMLPGVAGKGLGGDGAIMVWYIML